MIFFDYSLGGCCVCWGGLCVVRKKGVECLLHFWKRILYCWMVYEMVLKLCFA